MGKAKYPPHIGEEYNNGITGIGKILFVGGHHHCLYSNRLSKYKCSIAKGKVCNIENEECPTFARPNIGCPLQELCRSKEDEKYNEEICSQRIQLCCETRYSVWDYVKNHNEQTLNFIFGAIEEFRQKLCSVIDSYKFYKHLAFANYVQRITTNSKNSPITIEQADLDYLYNMTGFEANYRTLMPDVIVVIHFKEIKDIIEKRLCNLQDGENFVELYELEGQDNKFYVFAQKSSELYKAFRTNYLLPYSDFIYKERKEKHAVTGKQRISDNQIAAVIVYHLLDEQKSDIKAIQIYKDLQQSYELFPGEDINKKSISCNKEVNRLREKEELIKTNELYNRLVHSYKHFVMQKQSHLVLNTEK